MLLNINEVQGSLFPELMIDNKAYGERTAKRDYIEAPLTIMRTTTARWRERQGAWYSIVGDVGMVNAGRSDGLVYNDTTRGDAGFYDRKDEMERQLKSEGKMQEHEKLTTKEYIDNYYVRPEGRAQHSTSQFDPVLAELMLRWFAPERGVVLDPFGGAVERGLVASYLGYDYTGIELRQEQIDANVQIMNQAKVDVPSYILGDSVDLLRLLPNGYKSDFVLTCPPYWNLEVYSDDPRDLSNMSWEAFTAAYSDVVAQCCRVMNFDSFAVWVTGDLMSKKRPKFLMRLPELTEELHIKNGVKLLSKITLVNSVGSARIAMRRNFESTRQITRTHQYVHIFCKGDPVSATQKLSPVVILENGE